jgi:ABC-type transport system involved in multi-copper enzyme maturation permease subunit
MLTIARNAFLESIRRPVFGVLLLAGLLAMVLNVSLAAFTLDDDNKILVDLGLSTLFLCGLLLAACTATTVLTREIENRTVLTVVSKPVPRPAVVLGKYLGVVAALTVGFWTLTVAFLLTLRHRVPSGTDQEGDFDMPVLVLGFLAVVVAVVMAGATNYLHGRPFSSTFVIGLVATASAAIIGVACLDRHWRVQNPLREWDAQVMIAVALVFEAVLLLAAVAIAASTRLGNVMTVLVCGGVFLAGLVSEYFLGSLLARETAAPTWARWLAWPLYAAIPNMQFFWTADALTQGHALTMTHLAHVSLYMVAMSAAFIGLAVALFQSRDVG